MGIGSSPTPSGTGAGRRTCRRDVPLIISQSGRRSERYQRRAVFPVSGSASPPPTGALCHHDSVRQPPTGEDLGLGMSGTMGPMSGSGVFEIKLLIETDDEVEVEGFADKIGKLACPIDDFETHECRVPWFVMTHRLDDAEAEEVR